MNARTLLGIALAATLAFLTPVRGEEAAKAAGGSRVQEVIIVFKTHFDIGYTDMAVNVVKRYRTTMIDQALKVVEQNRGLPAEQQFTWTIPGWPLSKILDDWPGQTAERKQKILDAFRAKRFVVHALPFSMHTESLDLEDLVSGLGFASAVSRAAGVGLPRDAKMTDVPCHTWLVPTLLRHAGVDFLHLGCNSASSSPDVPPLFWWEGPDGSRLLTMYSAGGYGTGLVPPNDWPHRTWLALIHTGDNHGPPRPEEVKKLLDEAAKMLPGVKVRIGRLSDFADSLLAEKPELPVVRGDMPDTWIHGPMCDPYGASLARNIRPTITATQLLNTELRAWGNDVPDTGSTIAAAREQSLLYGEHTWGGALYWITKYGKQIDFPYGDLWRKERAAGRFKRLEASWAEHTGYIEKAARLIEPALKANLEWLARDMKVTGPRVVVFNPLPWKRDGLVVLNYSTLFPDAMRPVDGTQVEPAQSEGWVMRFVARDVPALGYRTYVPVRFGGVSRAAPIAPAEAAACHRDEKTGAMESPFFKVMLDPARGTIRSLVDKRTGRELVAESGPYGFGQYLYERFDADQVAAYVKAYVKKNTDWAIAELGKPPMPPASEVPYRAASPKDFSLSVIKGPVSVNALMGAEAGNGIPNSVMTAVVLYRDLPYLDLEIVLHEKPADPWPEAGWLCLPVKAESPRFRVGRPGSIIDPATDIVPGANRHLMAVNTGLTVADSQGHGLGICPLDNFLVSLDTPGCMKYSHDFVPRKPVVFINLFNNQWTTNFRLWNEGTWTSRVRIWAIDREDADSSLVRPSLEARQPLVAGEFDGPAGTLAPTQAGIELSRGGAAVTFFGANPDGPGTVLRLWEQAGNSGPCAVRLPAGMAVAKVQPVDLRGQAIGAALEVKDHAFTVPLRRFAPASCVIQ